MPKGVYDHSKQKKQICKYGHDILICGRNSHGNCRECLRERGRIRHKNQTEEYKAKERIRTRNYARIHREQAHQRYLANKDKIMAVKKIYNEAHKEERREYMRNYNKIREQIDIPFKLTRRLRHRLSSALKGNFKTGSAIQELGCSIDFLKRYLEERFLPGMTWHNYGYGSDKWNIDHIIPLSKFDLTNREQFLKAVYYTNLQPLWQLDNFKKGGVNRGS